MKWHDCKTDPPKSTDIYLLVYRITYTNHICWDSAVYSAETGYWEDVRNYGFFYRGMYEPIKWAEVNLDEDE